MTYRRLNVVGGWAMRDLIVDWRMTLLSVLLLAGLAVSPLVLHVVRVGVIDGWIHSLAQDPRNREVIVISERNLTPRILLDVSTWPETGFVIPEPTAFISSVRLKGPLGIEALDMRTSGPGDPILGDTKAPDAQSVTLTREAADLLGVTTGDEVALIGSRLPRASPRQIVSVSMIVAGVVPESTWGGRIAFLSPERAAGLTDWIASADGPPLPPGTDGTLREQGQGPWSGLRIYATDIALVEALRDRMRAAGFDVRLDNRPGGQNDAPLRSAGTAGDDDLVGRGGGFRIGRLVSSASVDHAPPTRGGADVCCRPVAWGYCVFLCCSNRARHRDGAVAGRIDGHSGTRAGRRPRG